MVTDRKRIFISLITGLICASFMAVGFDMDHYGELNPGTVSVLIFAITLAVMCAASYLLLGVRRDISHFLSRRVSVRLPFVVTWLIIIGCWIPVLLAEYPGFFVYDAVDEYVSVATRTFTTHHPLLHTLLLGGAVYGGEVKLGSANAGIMLYISVQMLLLSYIFAGTVDRMKSFRLTATLFYALFPTVVMFALCSVKDTLFAAAMLAFVVDRGGSACQRDGSSAIKCVGRTVPLTHTLTHAIPLTLMMLLRHNAVYAVFVLLAAEIIAAAAESSKPSLRSASDDPGLPGDSGSPSSSFTRYGRLISVAVSLILYFAINTVLVMATGADTGIREHQEILTVPIQQIARTYDTYSDELSREEEEKLFEYLPEEAFVHYTPQLSDPVKMYFDNDAYEADPSGFWDIWKRGLAAHPVSYINAWLNTCYGYFYPFTVVNVYEGHTVYTFTYTESSYFGYEVEYPGTRHSLIPVIDRFYRWISLDDDIQRIPVISLTFSMAALAWVYLLAMSVFIYGRERELVITYILPAAVWATLLPGPTFLPRYTVFLWFLLPYTVDRMLDPDMI